MRGRLVNRNIKSQTEHGTLTEEGQRIVLRAAFERQSRHMCIEIGAVHEVIYTMVAITRNGRIVAEWMRRAHMASCDTDAHRRRPCAQPKTKRLEMTAGLQRCSHSCSNATRLQALALHAEISQNTVVFACHSAFAFSSKVKTQTERSAIAHPRSSRRFFRAAEARACERQ